jgi:ribonuclease-3
MMRNAPNLEQRSNHLYGNALEALIGAIYLDRGYGKARTFVIRKVIRQYMDLSKLAGKDSDYKSRLIEWAQKHKKEIVFETNEAHRANNKKPAFIALVKLGEDQLGSGTGGSKKEAEQHAAKMTLSSLKDT